MPLVRRCPWLTRRTELRMAGACLPRPAGWAAGEACPRGPDSPAPRAAAGRALQLLAVSLAPRSPAAPPGPGCPPPAARARAPRPRQPPRPAPTTAPTTSTTSSTPRKSPHIPIGVKNSVWQSTSLQAAAAAVRSRLVRLASCSAAQQPTINVAPAAAAVTFSNRCWVSREGPVPQLTPVS